MTDMGGVKDWTPEQLIESAAFFGGCPECHLPGYLVDVGPQEWMVCWDHKVRWLWGWTSTMSIDLDTGETEFVGERLAVDTSGAVGTVPHDSPGDSESQWLRIAEFRDVDPWYPQAHGCAHWNEDGWGSGWVAGNGDDAAA